VRIRTAALLLVCLSPFAAQAERPVLEISNPTFRPLPLAIATPLGDATPGAELEETVAFDLLVSGLFDVVPRKAHLADPKEPSDAAKIAWSRWSDVGADALVKIETTGEVATLRLFDVATRKLEVEKQGSVKKGEARRLAHAFADALVQHFTREPGAFSTRIAYVRKAKGAKEIWASDWDGRNAGPVTERGGIAMLPSFSPDGSRLAFTYYRRTASYPNGHPEIWVAELGGGKLTPLMARGDLNTGASWCRDGSRVAFTLSEEGNTEIWVMNADGSGQKQLTRAPGIDTSPAFSPDCKRIAFVSDRGGTPQLYLMGADGAGVERLTRLGNYNQTPAWSPRGDLIAFTARDERLVFDVFTIDVATREVKRVTQDQGNNEHPAWAPNGRLLIFASTREGKGALFVSSADGNVQRRVSPSDGGEYTAPTWGPFPRR
jgi:TolB protein